MEYSPKRLLQKMLHKRQERKYEEEVELQKDSYAAFLRTFEAKNGAAPQDDVFVLSDNPLRQKAENFLNKYGKTLAIGLGRCPDSLLALLSGSDLSEAEYLLFTETAGKLSLHVLPEMEAYFEKHREINVIYFHTDNMDDRGRRSHPHFLPEWSPDTLASGFYFGGCFAVRRKAFQDALRKLTLVAEKDNVTGGIPLLLYAAVLLLTAHHPAVLMDAVMYHKTVSLKQCGSEENSMENAGKTIPESCVDGLLIDKAFQRFASADLEEVGGRKDWGRWESYRKRREIFREVHKISILIPSRDHPDILKRCVASIRRYAGITYPEGTVSYEMVVIDNGSIPENRRLYEAYAEEFAYRYEYRPMEFNFSVMCNLAAEAAEGDYYLFLNDDIEILGDGWLEKLLELACLPHIGAVGAKLLYPSTTLIQHAGITNMYEGPAHKLLRYDDRREYYHGRNRGVWNMIGVTAACLMISREKFERIGGFSEALRVAYNDVDLCFRLHQKGLYSVLRNDVVLYHHESLSRGNDHLDPEKSARLASERKLLYQRNPAYYDYDPFYSRHLTGASEAYECCLPYENRNIEPVCRIKKLSGEYPGIEINEAMIIRVDRAEQEQFTRQGGVLTYLIDLHAHVRGLDSCDYRYRMILKGEQGCYEIPVIRRLRPDVIKIIDNEKHVELSGFVARIPAGMLPDGTYEIWMEAKCIYSRQRLCNRAREVLVVRKECNEKRR